MSATTVKGGNTSGDGNVLIDRVSSQDAQVVKAAFGDENTITRVTTSDPLPVTTPVVASATPANVSDSTTSQTLCAANSNRKGLVIHNDSSATLYVKYGATASLTSFTVAIPGYGSGVMVAPIYTGVVDGIWSADTSSGAARVTEL